MGKFKRGISGNPDGRPKGAKNKVTAALMEKINKIVESSLDTIESDLAALEPRDRLRLIIQLLNYALPKRQSVAIPFNFEGDDENAFDNKIVIVEGNEELQRLNKAEERLRRERERLEELQG